MLYDEVRDFILKHGVTLEESQMQTYSLPGGSSQISRGSLIFKAPREEGAGEKECIRVHIVGSSVGETKMMLDIDEEVFPSARVSALEEDLDFAFGSYEIGR